MSLIHSGRLRSSVGGDPVAGNELVYVRVREGQGYKMTRAQAERYVARNKRARIVDQTSGPEQTGNDVGLAIVLRDELMRMSRADLDEHAESAGVEDPVKLPNKEAVVDAILEAEKE